MPLSLSLSPRYDLYRLLLDKSFIPSNLWPKYEKMLRDSASVFTSPIDYINESIQGFEMPGISELTSMQEQHSTNSNIRSQHSLNVEPKREDSYISPANPLDLINKELKITFRMNQGFYNYFMLYESIFWKITKAPATQPNDEITIQVLDEQGLVASEVYFQDCLITGLDALSLSYSKMERSVETFDLTMRFNNIDFEFITHTSQD